MFSYHSIAELVKAAETAGVSISRIALGDQAQAMEKDEGELYALMKRNLAVMREAVEKGGDKGLKSGSGLTGGDGWRLAEYAARDKTEPRGAPISGTFCSKAVARAVAIAEYNAAMGKIVAAPTAGSCGILPAAILTMQEERGLDDGAAVMALFLAGAFGMVIVNQASISGAEGGCQAECGSAAALAAAALVEMAGGSPQQCANALNIAITNLEGLVCDPVAGLVEVPCVMRNAGSVMIAISAADMALAGYTPLIPADEVIAAMREVGNALPATLRETGRGGLAVTPTGLALAKRIFGE